jgi:hypothetical protein
VNQLAEDDVDYKFRVFFTAFTDGMEAGLSGHYTLDNRNSPLYLRLWGLGWERGTQIRQMTAPENQ